MTVFRAFAALSCGVLAGAIQVTQQPLELAPSESPSCHTAVQGDECYAHVQWALSRGIRYHPEKFPAELHPSSTVEEVQAYLHTLEGMRGVCSPPCFFGARTPPAQRGMADLLGEECKTAAEGTTCHNEVTWAMEHGVIEHPEWYGMLTSSSTFQDFQAFLHGQEKYSHICSKPCDNGSNCRTAAAGDDCFPHVQWAMMRGIEHHPDKFPANFSTSSTFEEIQGYLHTLVPLNEACAKPCAEPSKERMRLRAPAAECYTAVKGDDCHEAVVWAMEHGIYDHPEWYGMLTPASSFKDFQMVLHGVRKFSDTCAAPCEEEFDPLPSVPTSEATEEDSDSCHTAAENDDCYGHVQWVLNRGIRFHPDRFPATFGSSTTFEEVQEYLHSKDQASTGCGRPCSGGASRPDARANSGTCHTAVEGEECHREVRWAMEHGVVEHPEWYPRLTAASSFEDFQSFLNGFAKFSKVCARPCDEHSTESPGTEESPWEKQTKQVEVQAPEGPAEAQAAPPPPAAAPAEVQQEEQCRTAQMGEPCYKLVDQIRRNSILYYPRFRGLTKNSTFEEVQAFLHGRDDYSKVCPDKPCEAKAERVAEEEGAATTTGLAADEKPLLEDEPAQQETRTYGEDGAPAPDLPLKRGDSDEDEPPMLFPPESRPPLAPLDAQPPSVVEPQRIHQAEMAPMPMLQPGCYMSQPSGCLFHPEAGSKMGEWVRHPEADSVGSNTDELVCMSRAKLIDSWCGTSNSKMLWVPPAAPEKPRARGCWVWRPSACPKKNVFNVRMEWDRDEWGEKNANAGSSEDACLRRKSQFDHFCGTASAQMVFVS